MLITCNKGLGTRLVHTYIVVVMMVVGPVMWPERVLKPRTSRSVDKSWRRY